MWLHEWCNTRLTSPSALSLCLRAVASLAFHTLLPLREDVSGGGGVEVLVTEARHLGPGLQNVCCMFLCIAFLKVGLKASVLRLAWEHIPSLKTLLGGPIEHLEQSHVQRWAQWWLSLEIVSKQNVSLVFFFSLACRWHQTEVHVCCVHAYLTSTLSPFCNVQLYLLAWARR